MNIHAEILSKMQVNLTQANINKTIHHYQVDSIPEIQG